MKKKPDRQQILLFCEDCGEKNFLSLNLAEEKRQEIKFRCQACNYLNTVLPPEPLPKTP